MTVHAHQPPVYARSLVSIGVIGSVAIAATVVGALFLARRRAQARPSALATATTSHESAAVPVPTLGTAAPNPSGSPSPKLVVFISYAHESEKHKALALELAQRLRSDGLDCRIDQFINGSPLEGWPLWAEHQIEESRFVLIIGSAAYMRRYNAVEPPTVGRGAIWEGAIVRTDLYNGAAKNTKFIPVLFGGGPELLPKPLRAYTAYALPADYQKLLRALTGQPLVVPNDIGNIPPLRPA